jgi:G:T-mismatch repair DNA endonuclease (very short patch repair protein)
MRNQILEIINQNPKTYKHIIKKDVKLWSWIEKNCLVLINHIPSKIYSAVYQESNICKYGNTKKFVRFSSGFSFCGPASDCKCTKESIAQSVKKTKSNYSDYKKQEINKKRSRSMIEKYGVEYNSQRQEIKQIWNKPKINQSVYEKLTDYKWLYNEYVTNDRSAVDIADQLDIYYSTVIEYCKSHNFKIKQKSQYSLTEVKIANFIKELGFSVETNNRELLDKKEIDIFIPSKQLAIEVNGLYWHSYNKKQNDVEDKTRHLTKTELAEELGISLLHITDWEWNNKQDIVKSIIRSKLNLNKKIHGRKTVVKTVSPSESKKFLTENHIQGYCSSSTKIGLYYNNQLVMLLTAGKNRFKKDCVELHRLASLNGFTVVGGASKLLKHLKNQIDEPIISYCDRDKSSGNVYKTLGFKLVDKTGPGYFWTDGNEMFSRYKCQKQNLKKWLKSFNPSKSESENMFEAGYRRYWNSGNLVFISQ